MPYPKDKNVETVDSSSNTENTLAEVVEQYTNTVVPMENTKLNDPHLSPFDSENGKKMELWLQYLNETCRKHNKNEADFRRSYRWVTYPIQTVNDSQIPKYTYTEWLTVATKLLKIQESSPEQNTVRNNEPPMRTRPNFSPRQQPTFVPRPQNSFFSPSFQNFSRSRPNNFLNPHSNTFVNQGFRPNHNAQFQNGLPSSPCRICTRQDPVCQQRTVQSSGASVMVWAVCSWRDMGPLIRLETTLTGDRYLSILPDHLHSFMSIVHSDGLGQFQQDTATPHASRVATK
ncbi:hypothetical protein AVEN_53905-1 [Araneus ventricosus]|uniref:Uncharacterized protein n=1 Tax=Araneus ventricosus TaxID=182803 RepID=A0A4Y2IE97_ARAVE|nr:hypothetical protein AVEN_53905-1 [Araneus ventricosus]